MNPRIRTGFLISATLGLLNSGCGAPPDGDDESSTSSPAPVKARPSRLVDVNGRTVKRVAPDELRTLVDGLRADNRTKDADKLEEIFRTDTGELRNPEAYQERDEPSASQAIYLDDRSISYSVTFSFDRSCKWEWCGGFFPCRVCPNPAYDPVSPYVTAGTGDAGDRFGNKTIEDVNFRQDTSLTPAGAWTSPSFGFWVIKANGSQQYAHVGGGVNTDHITTAGGKITSLQLRMDHGNPWFGTFGGSRLNTGNGISAYTSNTSISQVTDSSGFDSFNMNLYWFD